MTTAKAKAEQQAELAVPALEDTNEDAAARVAELERELAAAQEAALKVAELERENEALRAENARRATATEIVASTAEGEAEDQAANQVPAELGGYFRRPDAFRSWRIVARNANFTGETERFAFTNGVATVAPLPANATEGQVAARLLRLNNIRNYDVFPREVVERGSVRVWVTKRYPGYRVLTPEQYDLENATNAEDAAFDVPEDL